MSVTISGSGQIIKQVIQTVKTDTFTTTSTTFTDITGMTATITPTNSSNKIMVVIQLSVGTGVGANNCGIMLVRNGTNIYYGDAGGASQVQATIMSYSVDNNTCMASIIDYLDSPATTSAVTYKLQLKNNNASTAGINRSVNDSGTSSYRTTSSITLYEVAYA